MSSARTAESSHTDSNTTEKKTQSDPNDESASKKNDGKAEEAGDTKVFFLEPVGMALNLVGLGLVEPIRVTVGHHEIVHDIRQIVYITPEICYKTCFTIQLNGQRLDEFADFASIEGLKEDSTLKLIEEPYTLRDSKVHVRRVRELLSSTLSGNLVGLVYGIGQSPSFLSTIMQADPEERLASCSVSKTEKDSGINAIPPDYILPPKDDQDASAATGPPLMPLLLSQQEPKLIHCIRDITYSSWNPPPNSRKMKGDLIYLDVVTLDDKKYCITGTPAGFYVNRCDDTQFDPSPAKEPCKDYTLIGLLSQLIPSFRKNFASLTKACIKDHVIEHCPSLFTVNVWVSQRQQHTKDSLRADDAVNMWSLVQGDELTGQNREWHEELMQVREMPKTTLQQRINRMRLLFKWTTDFVAVATKACCLAVDGNIYPLNPTAEERMLMYHWNNVLLIYAKDTGLYSEVGGDEAAHVMASNDLKGIDQFNKIDVSGIYTIGSTVVDYRGRRLMAQTAVPGLLRRSPSQDSEVKRGSIDLGKTIAYCENFENRLKEPAEKLRMRAHKVLNEKDEELMLHFSADSKGVLGTDGRYYIIDLWRINPPDVNFLDVPRITKHPVEDAILSDEESRDEEKDKPPFQFPKHKHCVHTLRQEAVSNFVRVRYFKYLKIAALQMAESQRPPKDAQPVIDNDSVANESTDSDTMQTDSKPDETRLHEESRQTDSEPGQEDSNPPETCQDDSPPSQATVVNELSCDSTGVQSETSDCKELPVELDSVQEEKFKNKEENKQEDRQGEESKAENSEEKKEEQSVVDAVDNSGNVEMADKLETEPWKENQLQSSEMAGFNSSNSELSCLHSTAPEEKGELSVSEKDDNVHTSLENMNGSKNGLKEEQVRGDTVEFFTASSSAELDYAKKLRSNKFKFVTASEQGTLHSNDPQTEEALLAAAKIAGSSSDKEFTILFNPDVHAPCRAADPEEVLMADRLLVQDATDHLVHKIIPSLINGMASSVLAPTDGIALTALMRSRGINMRYLGKIAYLVDGNSQLDYVFRICVLEMIGRGVKHVFRRYLHEASLHTTASTVAHLLNCLLGSSDSYQLPHVLDEQLYKSSKTKKKRSKKRGGGGGGGGRPQVQNDKTSSGDGLGTALNAVSPAKLWQEVIDDANDYYGYQLHQCSNCLDAVNKYGFRRISLLRLVCKKLGFQLALREYDFMNKKQPPFTDDDVVDIVPIVKYVSPTAGDTASLCEGAEARMHTGRFAEAMGILLEAMNIYQQVYGAIHEDLGTIFRLLARIHFLMEDMPQAISYQKKATVVCERALGIDHPETIVAYVHLGLYCQSAGQVSIALRLMYRARYLTLLAYGEGHPDLATIDVWSG
jgi:hypothetical protein